MWKRPAGFILLAAFMLPLFLYGVVGLYTRYAADDYETAGSLNRYGFWGSQQYWYQNWSGRYAYFVTVNLFEMLGVRAAPLLTFICLALWILAASWTIYQLLRREPIQHPAFLAILGASWILLITLRSMDHIHQILFWVTGILTYTIYLVLLTFFVGILIYRLHHPYTVRILWWEVIGVGLYAFVLTGLSEMSASLQLLAAGLAVLLFVFWHSDPQIRRTGLTLSFTMLLTTIAGFVILFAAPGNAIRSAIALPCTIPHELIWHANVNTLTFIAAWFKKNAILGGISFFLPALLAFALYQPRLDTNQLLRREKAVFYGLPISALLLYLALLSQFATAYYAISAMPPDRAQVIAQYLLTTTVTVWGYWSGSLLKGLLPFERPTPSALKVIGVSLVGLMLLYGPLYASTSIYTMIVPARARAIEWDERDQVIHQAIQAGERHVVVWYIQDLNRLGDYSSEPTFLVNRAAADYYGLDTIIALDERPPQP